MTNQESDAATMDKPLRLSISEINNEDVPSKEDILNVLSNFGNNHYGDQSSVTSNGSIASEYLSPGSVCSSVDADIDDSSQVYIPEPPEISNQNSYSTEWELLFEQSDYLKKIRNYGIVGQLRSCRFRSVCWKLFLEVLPGNIEQWLTHTRKWRNKYENLKQTLVANPRSKFSSADLSLNNPLSQEENSPWNQFFRDNELRLTIKQDVIRTFPEIEFFQDASLHGKMIDILFCCAKSRSRVSYKQGMHELLAPLIFVLHCDHQAFLHACEIESVNLISLPERDILKEIMDPDFIEHDAYAMFYQIMESVESWYVSKEITPPPKSTSSVNSQPFAKINEFHSSNVIITKLTRIQDYLLRRVDNELYSHLITMDIPPQIYGIRWVRLMFGREFPMQDLLMVWDAIFADGVSFDLVDYIFVAMLLYIRDALLTSDYPSCLQLLMKYPPVGDVHYFVNKAFYLREPSQYPAPPTYTYQKPGERSERRRSQKGNNVLSGFSSLTRRMNTKRPKSLSVGQDGSVRSNSEPNTLTTELDSPSLSLPPPQDKRKGSTASLSKIEGVEPYKGQGLRPAASTQSLATTASPQSVTSTEESPSNRKFNSLQRTVRKTKKDRSWEHEYIISMARLSDLEAMNRKCAEKMDFHIRKIQYEVMQKSFEHEDELLLALAGLKQVRDVLKGSLKPSSLCENAGEELKVVANGNSISDYISTPDLLSDSDLQSPIVNGVDEIHDIEVPAARGRSREKKLLNGSPRSDEKAREFARVNGLPPPQMARKSRSRDPSPIQRMADMLRASFTKY